MSNRESDIAKVRHWLQKNEHIKTSVILEALVREFEANVLPYANDVLDLVNNLRHAAEFLKGEND